MSTTRNGRLDRLLGRTTRAATSNAPEKSLRASSVRHADTYIQGVTLSQLADYATAQAGSRTPSRC